MNPYPKPATSLDAWAVPDRAEHVSLDFEFDKNGRPTIMGLSAGGSCVSVRWDYRCAAKLKELGNTALHWVGHNFVDADRPLVKEFAGVDIPLERVEDTIVQHMLANAYFQNVGNKRKGDNVDGDGDARGIGMLDLWSFVGLYTELPNWKKCRDGLAWDAGYAFPERCSGPCPVHNKIWYNAIDAYGPDIALPNLHADLEYKKVPRSLVLRVQEYCEVARRMQATGLRVDIEYRDALNREFAEEKEKLFPQVTGYKDCGVCGRMAAPPCKKCRECERPLSSENRGQREVEGYNAPFAPRSPKQITEWFSAQGIALRSTSKDDILKAVDKADEEHGGYGWLETLFAYKNLGKGTDSWLADSLLTGTFLHPRTIPYGAASGRTASSRPNYQNFPKKKKGLMSRIRNCILPISPDHVLVRADCGQLEYRGMLWYAYTWIMGRAFPALAAELFNPMLPSFGKLLKRTATLSDRSERDVLKTVIYAALYNEGIQVRAGAELALPRTKAAIAAGALVVHTDWECGGGLVCYTGVNLADRLFGGHSFAQRKLALEIQERFFALPGGRELRLVHRYVAEQAEKGFVSSHTGRYLKLVGSMGDRIKDGSAHLGQGLTDYVQEAILKYHRAGEIPYMMVHDELIFNRPRGETDRQHWEFMQVMKEPSALFEGFSTPIEVKVGDRWGQMREIVL